MKEQTKALERHEYADRIWRLDDNTQLDTNDAAILLGQAPATLKKWRTMRVGPDYTRGKPVSYSVGSLKRYIAKQEVNFG